MFAARTITSSILVLGVTAVLVAQAPVLDVKLGLWENTVVTNMGGAAMPQIDMSKLPPDQAAKIAEAMKGMTGDQTMTEKDCLTKEDLAKDSFMMPEDSKMICKRTVTTNTRATFAADIDCTGETATKGQITVESLDGGSAYKSTMKMATTSRGRTMNLTMTMTGKYLGPTCGDVK
jgi:Protein of unknown function (DUF3617)